MNTKIQLFCISIFLFIVTSLTPPLAFSQDDLSESDSEKRVNNELSSLVLGVMTGVASSLVASLIFWYSFYRKKPKILISDNISKFQYREATSTSTSTCVLFAIKIVNKTPTEIINVNFELLLAKIVGYSTKTNSQGKPINVPNIKLEGIQIGRREPQKYIMAIDRLDLNDNECKYAQQLIIAEDIENRLNETGDNSFLLFKIIATHSTSGFSKVFEKRYKLRHIKSGIFLGGEEMSIESSYAQRTDI